jgi:hypothetical protein
MNPGTDEGESKGRKWNDGQNVNKELLFENRDTRTEEKNSSKKRNKIKMRMIGIKRKIKVQKGIANKKL